MKKAGKMSLGWMFSGRVPGKENKEVESVLFSEDIDPSRAYWDLETVGVTNEPDDAEDVENGI